MNAPTESPTKRTRAVDVQVPGAPTAAPVLEKAPDAAGATTVDVQVPAQPDMEALKAQLLEQARAEAREEVHAELASHVEAASNVLQNVKAAPAGKPSRGSYRTMHAADIDHTKLTAPVMTADGWLCPPAPTAKA